MRPYPTGFTLPEVMIVITIMAATMGMAAPRIGQTLEREAVRGAKVMLATHVARARGVAASRGCRGVMHVVDGADARVWVTSCAIADTAVDTVGTVDLHVQGGFQFYGITIVKGRLKTTGTGGHFNGAVMAANVDLDDNTILGNALVKYSSCTVQKALTAASPATLLRSRGWVYAY